MKKGPFKMKSFSGFKNSPAKIFGGKTRRMKLARKYELEDREERRQQSYVGGGSFKPM